MKRRVHMGLFNGRKKFKGGAFYGFRDLGDGADELLLFLSHVERTAAASGIEISGEPKRLDAGGFWFVYYPLADGGDLSIDPRQLGPYADIDVHLDSKVGKDGWKRFMDALGKSLESDAHFDDPRTPWR